MPLPHNRATILQHPVWYLFYQCCVKIGFHFSVELFYLLLLIRDNLSRKYSSANALILVGSLYTCAWPWVLQHTFYTASARFPWWVIFVLFSFISIAMILALFCIAFFSSLRPSLSINSCLLQKKLFMKFNDSASLRKVRPANLFCISWVCVDFNSLWLFLNLLFFVYASCFAIV